MGRKRIIPESDIPLIKQWLKEGRKYADIATHYNLKSWKTVSRFVQEVMQINKFTDISEPELIQILRNELQVDEKQTKGFSLLKPALAREFDIRVPDRILKKCMRLAAGKLTTMRNPRTGKRNINGPFPILCAGPYQRLHCDQYEKLWPYGFMMYGGRDRASSYVPLLGVGRNKKPETILLIAKAGFEHTRNVLPYQTQFDCGTEGIKMQELMWNNIGPESVYTGECKRNNIIEGFWRILHNGVIWYYRLEFYYLQSVQLLDTLNPIHISSLWWSHAHHLQDDVDKFVSDYNGHTVRKMKKNKKNSKCPKFVFQSLFRDQSGGNYMKVYEPNTIIAGYDEYVAKVDEYISTQQMPGERQYKLPSELWVPSNEQQVELPQYCENVDFGQDIGCIAQEENDDWNDKDIHKIMEGRGKANIEYLSVLGQKIRCKLVDSLMWEMVQQKSFGNAAQFRMLQYLMVRGITEIILEECDVEMREYSPHVMHKMNLFKNELSVALCEIMEIYGLCLEDLVIPELLELSQ